MYFGVFRETSTHPDMESIKNHRYEEGKSLPIHTETTSPGTS
jgi:hypothetical protein